jgi:uncharacterized phage protein (TIGR02218 family)
MNYLTRPVFEFAIDWSDPVSKAFAFDLRQVRLGYNAPVNTTLQSHVGQGFNVSVQLRDAAAIAEFDAFTDALTGRLVGCWFPAAFEGMQIKNVVSTTVFDIADQGLRNTLLDHPDQYLFFLKAGQTSVPAKIVSVVLNGAVERVTVDAAVAFLDVRTVVRRLHYVRLADDVERARFIAEGWQQREVRVLELPTEYAAFETGEKKIYLYKFWCPDPVGVAWHYTSFAAPVFSNDVLHTPHGIEHQQRRNGVTGDDSLTIEAAWDANHPFALWFPIPISAPMFARVQETTVADPDTVTTIFSGRVGPPKDKGESLAAKCETFGALLKRKVTRMMISPRCNHQLFDVNCRVTMGFYKTSAVITANHSGEYPPTLVVTLDADTAPRQAADFFAQGWIESRGGVEFEIRTVLASSYDAGDLTLTLNLALQHAEVGDRISLTPGCDGEGETCLAKFNNFDNFGGFRAVPNKNLSLKSVDQEQNVGNKK